MTAFAVCCQGLLLLVGALTGVLADTTSQAALTLEGHPIFEWDRLFFGAVLALVFGVIGIGLMALGFKVFDWITPHLNIEQELAEKQNIAVAILCSAVLIGVSIIVAIVVR